MESIKNTLWFRAIKGTGKSTIEAIVTERKFGFLLIYLILLKELIKVYKSSYY